MEANHDMIGVDKLTYLQQQDRAIYPAKKTKGDIAASAAVTRISLNIMTITLKLDFWLPRGRGKKSNQVVPALLLKLKERQAFLAKKGREKVEA